MPPLGMALVLGVACSNDSIGEAPSRPAMSPVTTTADPPTPPSPEPTEPPLLLPNLSSLPAEDVHIEVAGAGTRLLRFAGVLANTGDGPLVVVTDESQPCPPNQRFASQIAYVDADRDGRYGIEVDTEQSATPAGCMLDHPTHDHWHFDASASYSVTRPASPTPIVRSDKVSFCLRDSRLLPGDGFVGTTETFGDCDYDSIQGISRGWGDVYRSDLDGQALPLPADLVDGVYCLTTSADPRDLLRETREDDNSSTVGVRIDGSTATVVATAPATCLHPPIADTRLELS
ncbi:MAG: lysyl oxidase family protein [Jiangellaceae bacterium]